MLAKTLLLLAVVMVLAPRAAAAECVVGPPSFFAEHADAVFSGTARKIEN
jgi:hypothetical protein